MSALATISSLVTTGFGGGGGGGGADLHALIANIAGKQHHRNISPIDIWHSP
jgi:hypothetical protein